jgi:hypothetical protein
MSSPPKGRDVPATSSHLTHGLSRAHLCGTKAKVVSFYKAVDPLCLLLSFQVGKFQPVYKSI